MRVNPGTILSAMIALIFLGVFLSILASVIPTAASSYHELAQSFSGNTTLYGAQASAFAGDSQDYMGWFWVIGAFVMTVLLVLAVFGIGRRR